MNQYRMPGMCTKVSPEHSMHTAGKNTAMTLFHSENVPNVILENPFGIGRCSGFKFLSAFDTLTSNVNNTAEC